MVDRVRPSVLALTCTIAACQRPPSASPEPPTPPGPIAEQDVGSGMLPIVIVPQTAAIEIGLWVFEPGGGRMASTEFGDCSVWDIESGRLIRSFEDPTTGPCADWLPAVEFAAFVRDESADGRLVVELGHNSVDFVELETSKVVASVKCPDCDQASASSWSTSGHQFAMAWEDPPRLKVWDADKATQIRAEDIPVGGELVGLELGWTEAGVTAAWTEQGFPVECEDYYYEDGCELDEDTQIHMRRPISSRMLVLAGADTKVVEVGHEAYGIDSVSFDPAGRWAIWDYEWSERRGGTTTELHFVSLWNLPSAMGWDSYDSYDDYDESISREGQWRSDGLSQWVVKVGVADYDGSPSALEWQTIVTSPITSAPWRSGVVAEDIEYDASVELELFGLTSEGLRFSGELCTSSCTRLGPPVPPDCTIVDIGSGHGAVLLDCGGTARLHDGGGARTLPVDAGAMDWWWSRAGVLAVFDGDTFVLADAAGSGSTQRKDVVEVFDARLGLELDRLAVTSSAGVELLDLRAGGKPLMSVAQSSPIDLALAPKGDRLALLEGDRVRVLAVPGGEELTSFSVTGSELAFRQDGKVIFVGVGVPEAAFDAASGAVLEGPEIEAALAVCEWGEIDPSWRWVMDDESSILSRTLDGLELQWAGASGAHLPSTGQYVGAGPGFEVAFRVGTDPWTVPIFDAEQLAKWLERPQLIEEFLDGRPIPPPQLSAGELAGLGHAPPSTRG